MCRGRNISSGGWSIAGVVPFTGLSGAAACFGRSPDTMSTCMCLHTTNNTKQVDTINEKFAEAREEIEYAREDAETVSDARTGRHADRSDRPIDFLGQLIVCPAHPDDGVLCCAVLCCYEHPTTHRAPTYLCTLAHTSVPPHTPSTITHPPPYTGIFQRVCRGCAHSSGRGA